MSLIQRLLPFILLVLALVFLLRKFVFKKKKKSCGTDGGCGCH